LVILFPKFLSTDEFGLTRIFIAASVIVSQLGSLGIVNISIRYFPIFKKPDDKNNNGFIFIGFILCSIGTLLCVLGLLIFRPYIIDIYLERSALFVNYYYWVFPICISLIYFNQFSSYARVILKSSLQTFTRDLLIRILHFASILTYALDLIDFEVFIARDGAEAIEIVENSIPDIILLDIMMPNVDGYQVLNYLKNSETLRKIKVIFLSAKNKETDIELGLQLGADKYISKPFSVKKIVSEILELLA
jgi:CheY-like chemotaxis protein